MMRNVTVGLSRVERMQPSRFRNEHPILRSTAVGIGSIIRTRSTTIAALFFFTLCFCCAAQHTRIQNFQLSEGWNAVFLAVEPLKNDPSELFSGKPIDIVAVFDEARTTGQFATDPNVDMLRQLGWGVWYAPARADSFLTDLGAINSNKGYLIHATEAFTLAITGSVEMPPVWWKSEAFNLTGYTLDDAAPPTFEQFFSGSDVLAGQDVYRLVNGVWKRITDLSTTPMRSGEAFWIYCAGACTYPGPLDVSAESLNGIVCENYAVDLTLRNRTALPVQPTVEHLANGSDVPMSIVIDAVNSDAGELTRIAVPMDNGSWSQPLPPLEGGASIRIPVQVRTDEINEAEVKTLLCVRTDLGTENWVPVTGLREDLK